MKFEDFLMQRCDERQKRLDLEDEVAKLKAELDEELRLNRVLQCALNRPTFHRPCISPLLPLQVQILLAEVTMVEEEIIWLERKIQDLKLHLYEEKLHIKEWKLQQQRQLHSNFLCSLGSLKKMEDHEQWPLPKLDLRSQRLLRGRKASLGSATEIRSMWWAHANDGEAERSRESNEQYQSILFPEISTEKPNKLSEDLLRCLISIFLKLNQKSSAWSTNQPQSTTIPKLTLSCMSSKGFMSKTTFNCKTPISSPDDQKLMLDPYGILNDLDGPIRDVGPYKNFIHFTRSSLDLSQMSECLPEIGKLRLSLGMLCSVDLSLLTYKQKLAFWINTYNACIMHVQEIFTSKKFAQDFFAYLSKAFLQHGLPSSPDKLLVLMNKAVVNVGGIVLNALAIEHFILRHPWELKYGAMDEKEALLRHAYGLGYPEPNVNFALCRGSWTSPALRVYTAENVVSELERAKVEYLEASVGVSCKKKILVPKLLQCHMRDFANDIESLLEWIYSQLPRSGPFKRLIMECLNRNSKLPITKIVEILPCESEFRYMLSL